MNIATLQQAFSYVLAFIVIGGPILIMAVVLWDSRQIGKSFDDEWTDKL